MSTTATTLSLPRWDLTDFYDSIEDSKIKQDLDNAEARAKAFLDTYTSKFKSSDGWQASDLATAIKEYEEIDEILGKVMSYAYLNYATYLSTPVIVGFFQKIQEKVTQISSYLVFFTLDINLLDETRLIEAYKENEELQRYKPWIDTSRLYRPYQLENQLEKLLLDKSLTSKSAWVRLYDETLAGLSFKHEGETLSIAQTLDLLSNKDPTIRQSGAHALSTGLKESLSLFTFITNVLAKDKEIEDKWRKFPHEIASRNLSNQVEDEIVEALIQSVQNNYRNLSHRYYALKAKCLGVDKIEYWDRNAPLPGSPEKLIDWEDAKTIVLDAYNSFSPKMAEIGQRFFDKNWIDVPALASKQSGAFSHPTVPSVHPYILLNYQGKLRDVMTLAHELGHGIHQVLASDLGLLLSSTPLTIAETASVFGEMMTFRSLLNKATSKAQKRNLISSKIDDMLNTSVRQTAFFLFEKEVHTRRKTGELTSEDLNKIWINTQKEALGPAVNLAPEIAPFWAYISHFIHAPFYVYAYAFGDCLVNSLYSLFEKGHPHFAEEYIKLLSAGGSKRHQELLAPFNLDARNPNFWQKGLDVINNLINDFEELV